MKQSSLVLGVLALSIGAVSPALADTAPSKGKILAVVASPAKNDLGWPVGFWAAELTAPYEELTHEGYTVEIASPDGGVVVPDGYSNPSDPSKYSASDFTSLGFLSSPVTAPLLMKTRPLSAVNANDYVAILVMGGMGPMFEFRQNALLQGLVRTFYESGRPTAALCHGTASLIDVKLSNGSYLIRGKTVTGFSKAEDDFADDYVKATLFSWHVEPAMKERGAHYVQGGLWADFAVQDKNLITGQQQNSGRSVARLVIAQLKKPAKH